MVCFRKWICALVFVATGVPTSLFAATPVRFEDADLNAFVQLVRPNESKLRLDGRLGEFRPGASLRFAGLESQDFELDLNLGAILADVRFNNLRMSALTMAFETDRVRLDMAFEDQEKAIKSALGSISVKGLVVSAWLRFAADGAPRIEYDTGAIYGEIRGSGLLKAKWILDAVKGFAMASFKRQLKLQLGRPLVQESIEKGFVTWARFSADERLERIVPGSPRLAPTGLTFEAE